VGDVSVEAAHARHHVAETLLGEDVGDAVSAIQVRWPCRSPWLVSPATSGSHEASGVPSWMIRMPWPPGGM
jgi:hypothetical protein